MSFFVTYDSSEACYTLTPMGYVGLVILMLAALFIPTLLNRNEHKKLTTKELVFCSVSIALATVTSFIKFASLPFGGSITLFSMFFISFIGYLYGIKIGIMTGIAYGILQLILGPYIYAPLQILLDYPLAFGALGLSGLFWKSKHGLLKGYIVGVAGRYIFHVISGYIFFADYAPEGMNPLIYTLGYNTTYIVPELVATSVLICIPAILNALNQVKKMAWEA